MLPFLRLHPTRSGGGPPPRELLEAVAALTGAPCAAPAAPGGGASAGGSGPGTPAAGSQHADFGRALWPSAIKLRPGTDELQELVQGMEGLSV